ncbi:MAG: general secretion pathway protein GspK [Myxococcales bacterium]|nr:general secretion pathway protein GspK [Myxococcales bacterium]
MVVVAIAVLTVVATEFAYNSRVDLQMAANQRDEVRAYFLARSGVGLSRLLLKFQRQLDQIQIPNPASLLAGLVGGAQAPGAQGAGANAFQPASMSLQLWRMAKVDCYMLQGMVNEVEEQKGGIGPRSKDLDFDRDNPEEAAKQRQRKFGGFEGCFQTRISDEEERLNLNKLDALALAGQVQLMQSLALFGDKRYEFLFEKEDSNRVKMAPTDLVLAMRDWVDEDEVQSAMNLSGQGEPFVKGFADENGLYDRYDPRYRAKNARFDSLDEVFMVHGVNDQFMAAFRDRLTIYPDMNSRLNVNSDDPMILALAVYSVADPMRPDPRLSDPIFMDGLIQKIRTARMFAVFGMTVADFVNVIAQAGVAVNSTILNNPQNQRYVGDKSSTYRIQAIGEAGSVSKTITAVVRLNEGLGTLVYWREE